MRVLAYHTCHFMIVSGHSWKVFTFNITFQSRHLFSFISRQLERSMSLFLFLFYFEALHWKPYIISWIGSEVTESTKPYRNTRHFFLATDMLRLGTKPWEILDVNNLVKELLPSSYNLGNNKKLTLKIIHTPLKKFLFRLGILLSLCLHLFYWYQSTSKTK